MTSPVSRFYFANRLRLHYVEWGRPDKPTLLLVHGGRDHCRSWDWTAQELAADYHIVAPDLRGHGDSAWAPGCGYTLTDVVADLVQLLRQRTQPKVHVVGHSFGGAASLLLAGLYPELVEKLVVVEGTWQWQMLQRPSSYAERMRDYVDTIHKLAARPPRKYASLTEATARMQAENSRLTPEQAAHLTIHGAHQNEDGTFSWKFDNHVRAPYPPRITSEDLQTVWSSITCPTLLLRGGDSWLEDPATNGVLSLFSNASTCTIPDAGHWPHHDQLDLFLNMVRGFLKP